MVQYWRLQAEQGAEAGSHQPVHSARGMLLPSVTLCGAMKDRKGKCKWMSKEQEIMVVERVQLKTGPLLKSWNSNPLNFFAYYHHVITKGKGIRLKVSELDYTASNEPSFK